MEVLPTTNPTKTEIPAYSCVRTNIHGDCPIVFFINGAISENREYISGHVFIREAMEPKQRTRD